MRHWTFDFENSFYVLVFAGLIALAFVGGVALTANHNVTRYYVTSAIGSQSGASCVAAERNWDMDEDVFCSVNPQAVLDFTEKANAELAKSGRR